VPENIDLGPIKKAGLFLLGIFALLGFGTYFWATYPVSVDREAPDPAVLHISQRSEGALSIDEGYHTFSGNSLHYVASGEGEAIVFLHGFPSFWFSFVRQFEHFQRSHRVIAIDGLGAGKSDAPSGHEDYKLGAMAAHLAALLDHLGEERVHVVGHDWGASLAIGFAQEYPDRVLSVTGISAPSLNAMLYGLENDPKARETAEYVERFKQANPALLVILGTADAIYDGAYRPLVDEGKLTAQEGALFRAATSDPKRTNAHINWYRANLPHPDELTQDDYWPSRDARVTVPALYIWDEEDPIYNQTALERLLSLSDTPELLVLPVTGHWPHVRASTKVNEAIARHLRKVASDGATVRD